MNCERVTRSFGFGILSLMVASCAPAASAPPGEELRSAHARIATTSTVTPEIRQLTHDNTAFGTDLYRQIAAPGGNLVFSPHSISIAMAMTWAGMRTNTASEVASAMHFTLAPADLHAAFNALDAQIASRSTTAVSSGRPFRLNVVNQLFSQRGYAFLPTFLDTLAENYGAGLRLLDITSNPDAARTTINQWVSDQTAQRIVDLIPSGSMDAATVLVLVNAVYFNASWLHPFETANTAPGEFHRADGSAVSAAMMRTSFRGSYATGDGWQAVELPYTGEQVSMVVIVPAAGTLAAFEAGLDASRIENIVTALSDYQITLSLPKFQFRTPVGLSAALQSLGIHDAFQPAVADLSGMDGTRNLFVQDVVHQGFIAVDERGTEAAAATAVTIGVTSAPPVATLVVDRPFLFIIRDRPTGAILFMGRVVDPTA